MTLRGPLLGLSGILASRIKSICMNRTTINLQLTSCVTVCRGLALWSHSNAPTSCFISVPKKSRWPDANPFFKPLSIIYYLVVILDALSSSAERQRVDNGQVAWAVVPRHGCVTVSGQWLAYHPYSVWFYDDTSVYKQSDDRGMHHLRG